MPHIQQSSVRNKVLGALAPEDFSLLQPHLEPMTLTLRDVPFGAGQAIEHVIFPEQGTVSLVADTNEGRFEVGMVGPEGIVGVPVSTQASASVHEPNGPTTPMPASSR